jgi:hypothetical protein
MRGLNEREHAHEQIYNKLLYQINYQRGLVTLPLKPGSSVLNPSGIGSATGGVGMSPVKAGQPSASNMIVALRDFRMVFSLVK